MWKNDFYPTPASMAEKMMNLLPDSAFKNSSMILEPSAGKGDLVTAYINAYKRKYYYNFDEKHILEHVHCVEIEPELQGILRSKNYQVVGSDFLTYNPDVKYSHIIMNPPFSDAVNHLLHAWNIVDDGGFIICILPDNFTENHPKLQNIIEAHGKIVSLGSFDTEDAFRKASVNVSAYILEKPAKERTEFSFDGLYDKDKERIFSGSENLQSEIAMRDVIGNYVHVYEKLIDIFIEIAQKTSEFTHYLDYLNVKLYEDSPFVKHLVAIAKAENDDDYRKEYNSFVATLKNRAWSQIFNMTNATNLMTSRVKEDFNKFQKEQTNLAFSKYNIEAFLRNLYLSQKDIKTQCIVEAFDKMTSFDKHNKIHIEGWKTNSFYKVNKKVIVPYGLSTWKFDTDRPHLNWTYRDTLNDIDKAMCFLQGVKFNDIISTSSVIESAKFFGEDYQSTFFKIRCYKKGTIHLTFLDMDLLALFNRVAVKDKWNLVGYED